MEYRGKIQTKIIRSQHEVYIRIGGGAESLKRALANVPDATRLMEIVEGEHDDITLVFEQEEEQAKA